MPWGKYRHSLRPKLSLTVPSNKIAASSKKKKLTSSEMRKKVCRIFPSSVTLADKFYRRRTVWRAASVARRSSRTRTTKRIARLQKFSFVCV